jgi:hypothetical protein
MWIPMAKNSHSEFKMQNKENLSRYHLLIRIWKHKSWTPINIRKQPVLRIRNRRMFLGLLDPAGSISQRYGSESFYHQAKIVGRTLIPTAL